MSEVVANPIFIDSNEPINKDMATLFNQFVSSLYSKGCQVFIVISPRFNEIIKNTSTIDYVKNMKNIHLIDSEKNVIFANEYKYYRDPDHLNISGATRFTNIIVEEIRKVNQTLNLNQ